MLQARVFPCDSEVRRFESERRAVEQCALCCRWYDGFAAVAIIGETMRRDRA